MNVDTYEYTDIYADGEWVSYGAGGESAGGVFHCQGTTKAVAEQLAKERNAFLWEIEPYGGVSQKAIPNFGLAGGEINE